MNEVVLFDYPLKQKTTWNVGGKARRAIFPESKERLVSSLRKALREEDPIALLGGGSNVLVSDRGFNGQVFFTEKIKKISCLPGPAQKTSVLLRADAGLALRSLLKVAVQQSLTGLEFCLGIPGSLGGALMGNAGAQGKAIGDLVQSIEIFSFLTQSVEQICPKEIQWGYRFSSLGEKPCAILGCTIELHKTNREEVLQKIRTYAEKRSKQPGVGKTAGSVFKNPSGDFAGRLLEVSHCKGVVIGGARVSEKHANFIENYKDATAQDILRLMFYCRDKVRTCTGRSLYPEVHFLGFDESETFFS